MNRNGCGGAGDPLASTRSVTGTIDVGIAKVSASPGAPRALPSACSTTTVATRAPLWTIGSIRISRGPTAPGATLSVAGPSTVSLLTSETRPAQASGTPAGSWIVMPVRPAWSSGIAAETTSNSRFSVA